MTFDTIIIGGGLCGLVAGIELQRAGQRTAIVSAGQSALHFWSGSFEFLSHGPQGDVVDAPMEAAASLPATHPYLRIGLSRTAELLERVAPLMAEGGIHTHGSLRHNHFRLSPMGLWRPAWLSLNDYFTVAHPSELRGHRFAIVNISGYLDFYPRFLAHGLAKVGADAECTQVDVAPLATLRKSTTEMRATNMSRVLQGAAINELAERIEQVSGGADAVVMPAVLGIFSDEPVEQLRAAVSRPVHFIATTPASVPGVRCQLALRDLYTRLGGTFVAGDTVQRGDIDAHRLRRLYTRNFGDMPLEAQSFLLASGSFFGQGLIATMNQIFEPVFGLDLDAPESRADWYDADFYAPQPYMKCGVRTDANFHPAVQGATIDNLFVAGSVLSGTDALTEGSGAGVALATALHTASLIANTPQL